MTDDPISERSRTFTWSDPIDAFREGRRLSGNELLEKMRRGEIPEPPFARLLGIELFDVDHGRVKMTLLPQEFHYNPMGCVHGGILSTLLDTVMAAAIQTALAPRQSYLTLSLNVTFLKPVFEKTGEIMADGMLVSVLRSVATAEGRILNVKGEICATGTTICQITGQSTGKSEAAENS
jgi:uncharacterized protein (TIGR00369 family)